MNISWQGLSSFEIVTKTVQGDVSIVVNPYDNATGLRFPKTLEADAVCMTHDTKEANNIAGVSGRPFVIDMPGEFEVKDVFFFMTDAPRKDGQEHRLLRIESEQMSLGHLGAIDRTLSNKELELLEGVDILCIPVGGHRVLDPKGAAEVITQIEPRVIIPMTYELPNLKETLGSLETFLKELGAHRKEEANKYKVSRKDLPEEDQLIMVLSR